MWEVFPDKPSVKVYSGFNIVYMLLHNADFHFWTVKQQNMFDFFFMVSIRHKMLCFRKMLVLFNGEDVFFCRKHLHVLCKNSEKCSAEIAEEYFS